jgi:hypothetical protein
MKKVLALVLAVLMLSTMAFASGITITVDGNSSNPGAVSGGSNAVTISEGTYQPGDKIYIYKDPANDVAGVKAVNSDNYSITKVKYNEGRSLVDDIYFDDDNDQVVIKLKDNTSLTTNKTLDMSFTLKGKGRDVEDIDVAIKDTTVGYGLLTGHIEIVDTDTVNITDRMFSASDEDAEKNFLKVTKASGAESSYGDMEFTTADGDVDVVVRVYDGDKLYVYNDVDADKDILKAYADSDAELTFLNFPGDTTFNATATVYFYKDEDSYIYEVKNGKLVESNAKWSEDDGAFVLKTRTLGNYVFSDVELNVTETVDDTTTNPDTGANDVVGIAAALGAVALVSAAAVSLKK